MTKTTWRDNMIKKIIKGFTVLIGAAAALLAGGLTASAVTVDDVWNEARAYGYPEEMIQDYYNLARAEYTDESDWNEENLQKAIDEIRAHGQYLTTGPQVSQQVVTTTTAVPVTEPENPGDTVVPGTTAPANTEPPITLTMADGTTITRIGKKEFIALSYEEKQAYIATFPPAQQQFIIDNLSPEERRSLLKQLPMDKKLETIDGMAGVMDEFGIKLTVQDINDDTVKLTLRNEEGELIGQSSIGRDIVENTGYDRRRVYAAAAGLFIIALAGTILIIRRYSPKGNMTNEEK